ncbi:MAG TPA: polyphosphate kinase 2 family protein [Longimicrobium sp.]|uniref:polyphosphate kinase 2 family protein n=1 Tax=Longimicrobium sp. TaxID=2029185 RepID=UPI002ED7CE7B
MSYAQRIEPGTRVSLGGIDPRDTSGVGKAQGQERFVALNAELAGLQELLYAAGTHGVLMILQGMDTSGKDGAVRGVLMNVNPQGCRVESFKVPTEEDLAHDFLWRVHKVTPGKGMLGVFNRSHYEDVLIARVHRFIPEEVWRARYEQINQFEQMLAASGTVILKFFLHISKDEQEKRLMEREQDPTKAWKLSASDWRERQYWDDYQRAYEDAISNCSTPHAPWYVVPADKKWFRNLAIAEVLAGTLRQHVPTWRAALDAMSAARVAELRTYREGLNAR